MTHAPSTTASFTLTRRRCVVGLMGAALAPLSLGGPRAAALSRWPTVQAVLDAFVAEGKAAGTAVAIAFGDDAPAYPAAGRLAFDSTAPFDENSLCRIYSITKNVTRTAALLLVEDGRIGLDQPVAEVLPEFRSLRVAIDIERGLAARPATRAMTIRHLITNTSGLGNWTPGSDGGDALHQLYRERGITPGNFGSLRKRPGYAPQVKDLNEMVKRLAEIPLAYEPGTRLHYSVGFDVMGLVIERVTGMGYDTFLEQRLFAPLNMRSTGLRVKAADATRLTTLYDATPDKRNSGPGAVITPHGMVITDDARTSEWLERPTLITGGAGIVSTARDLHRYAAMLKEEGALEGVRVMKPETARLVFANLAPKEAAQPDDGIAGAGTRAMMTPLAPPGTFNSAGASGPVYWIDNARRGVVVFMVQAMWGSPGSAPYPKRLIAAIEEDLSRTRRPA